MGNTLCDISDVGRFVTFATLGNGCEEGAVGFNEEAIAGDSPRRFLNLSGVFKRHDAADTYIETQIQEPLHFFWSAPPSSA